MHLMCLYQQTFEPRRKKRLNFLDVRSDATGNSWPTSAFSYDSSHGRFFFSVNFCWNVWGTAEPLRQQQGLGRDFVEVASAVSFSNPPLRFVVDVVVYSCNPKEILTHMYLFIQNKLWMIFLGFTDINGLVRDIAHPWNKTLTLHFWQWKKNLAQKKNAH